MRMTIPVRGLLAAAVVIPLLIAACGGGEPQELAFEMEIENQSLKQGDSVLKAKQDDTVTILVNSDEHLTFHLHGYDIEKEVEPGAPATLEFTANATGSFPFTIHIEADDSHGGHDENGEVGGDTELGRLEVQPR